MGANSIPATVEFVKEMVLKDKVDDGMYVVTNGRCYDKYENYGAKKNENKS